MADPQLTDKPPNRPAVAHAADNANATTPGIKETLHWPTKTMPPPPPGFKPEYMDEDGNNVARRIQDKVGWKEAGDIAKYIYDYSAKPVHVARRAAEQYAEQHGTPETPEAMDQFRAEMAKVNSQYDALMTIHKEMLANQYQNPSAEPDSPAPATAIDPEWLLSIKEKLDSQPQKAFKEFRERLSPKEQEVWDNLKPDPSTPEYDPHRLWIKAEMEWAEEKKRLDVKPLTKEERDKVEEWMKKYDAETEEGVKEIKEAYPSKDPLFIAEKEHQIRVARALVKEEAAIAEGILPKPTPDGPPEPKDSILNPEGSKLADPPKEKSKSPNTDIDDDSRVSFDPPKVKPPADAVPPETVKIPLEPPKPVTQFKGAIEVVPIVSDIAGEPLKVTVKLAQLATSEKGEVYYTIDVPAAESARGNLSHIKTKTGKLTPDAIENEPVLRAFLIKNFGEIKETNIDFSGTGVDTLSNMPPPLDYTSGPPTEIIPVNPPGAEDQPPPAKDVPAPTDNGAREAKALNPENKLPDTNTVKPPIRDVILDPPPPPPARGSKGGAAPPEGNGPLTVESLDPAKGVMGSPLFGSEPGVKIVPALAKIGLAFAGFSSVDPIGPSVAAEIQRASAAKLPSGQQNAGEIAKTPGKGPNPDGTPGEPSKNNPVIKSDPSQLKNTAADIIFAQLAKEAQEAQKAVENAWQEIADENAKTPVSPDVARPNASTPLAKELPYGDYGLPPGVEIGPNGEMQFGGVQRSSNLGIKISVVPADPKSGESPTLSGPEAIAKVRTWLDEMAPESRALLATAFPDLRVVVVDGTNVNAYYPSTDNFKPQNAGGFADGTTIYMASKARDPVGILSEELAHRITSGMYNNRNLPWAGSKSDNQDPRAKLFQEALSHDLERNGNLQDLGINSTYAPEKFAEEAMAKLARLKATNKWTPEVAQTHHELERYYNETFLKDVEIYRQTGKPLLPLAQMKELAPEAQQTLEQARLELEMRLKLGKESGMPANELKALDNARNTAAKMDADGRFMPEEAGRLLFVLDKSNPKLAEQVRGVLSEHNVSLPQNAPVSPDLAAAVDRLTPARPEPSTGRRGPSVMRNPGETPGAKNLRGQDPRFNPDGTNPEDPEGLNIKQQSKATTGAADNKTQGTKDASNEPKVTPQEPGRADGPATTPETKGSDPAKQKAGEAAPESSGIGEHLNVMYLMGIANGVDDFFKVDEGGQLHVDRAVRGATFTAGATGGIVANAGASRVLTQEYDAAKAAGLSDAEALAQASRAARGFTLLAHGCGGAIGAMQVYDGVQGLQNYISGKDQGTFAEVRAGLNAGFVIDGGATVSSSFLGAAAALLPETEWLGTAAGGISKVSGPVGMGLFALHLLSNGTNIPSFIPLSKGRLDPELPAGHVPGALEMVELYWKVQDKAGNQAKQDIEETLSKLDGLSVKKGVLQRLPEEYPNPKNYDNLSQALDILREMEAQKIRKHNGDKALTPQQRADLDAKFAENKTWHPTELHAMLTAARVSLCKDGKDICTTRGWDPNVYFPEHIIPQGGSGKYGGYYSGSLTDAGKHAEDAARSGGDGQDNASKGSNELLNLQSKVRELNAALGQLEGEATVDPKAQATGDSTYGFKVYHEVKEEKRWSERDFIIAENFNGDVPPGAISSTKPVHKDGFVTLEYVVSKPVSDDKGNSIIFKSYADEYLNAEKAQRVRANDAIKMEAIQKDQEKMSKEQDACRVSYAPFSGPLSAASVNLSKLMDDSPGLQPEIGRKDTTDLKLTPNATGVPVLDNYLNAWRYYKCTDADLSHIVYDTKDLKMHELKNAMAKDRELALGEATGMLLADAGQKASQKELFQRRQNLIDSHFEALNQVFSADPQIAKTTGWSAYAEARAAYQKTQTLVVGQFSNSQLRQTMLDAAESNMLMHMPQLDDGVFKALENPKLQELTDRAAAVSGALKSTDVSNPDPTWNKLLQQDTLTLRNEAIYLYNIGKLPKGTKSVDPLDMTAQDASAHDIKDICKPGADAGQALELYKILKSLKDVDKNDSKSGRQRVMEQVIIDKVANITGNEVATLEKRFSDPDELKKGASEYLAMKKTIENLKKFQEVHKDDKKPLDMNDPEVQEEIKKLKIDPKEIQREAEDLCKDPKQVKVILYTGYLTQIPEIQEQWDALAVQLAEGGDAAKKTIQVIGQARAEPYIKVLAGKYLEDKTLALPEVVQQQLTPYLGNDINTLNKLYNMPAEIGIQPQDKKSEAIARLHTAIIADRMQCGWDSESAQKDWDNIIAQIKESGMPEQGLIDWADTTTKSLSSLSGQIKDLYQAFVVYQKALGIPDSEIPVAFQKEVIDDPSWQSIPSTVDTLPQKVLHAKGIRTEFEKRKIVIDMLRKDVTEDVACDGLTGEEAAAKVKERLKDLSNKWYWRIPDDKNLANAPEFQDYKDLFEKRVALHALWRKYEDACLCGDQQQCSPAEMEHRYREYRGVCGVEECNQSGLDRLTLDMEKRLLLANCHDFRYAVLENVIWNTDIMEQNKQEGFFKLLNQRIEKDCSWGNISDDTARDAIKRGDHYLLQGLLDNQKKNSWSYQELVPIFNNIGEIQTDTYHSPNHKDPKPSAMLPHPKSENDQELANALASGNWNEIQDVFRKHNIGISNATGNPSLPCNVSTPLSPNV